MKHLTTREMFEIVDGTIANGEKTRIQSHLEMCERCRREVDFQKSIERSIRSIPLEKTSREFTAQVLRTVVPARKKSLSTKIIDSLGSLLAMAFVLTIVWYVITNPIVLSGKSQPSAFSQAAKTYVEFYASAKNFVTQEQTRVLGQPGKDQGARGDNVAVLTLVSILILVAVDKLLVRRVIKLRI